MTAHVQRQSCLPGQSDSSGSMPPGRIPVVDTHVHCFAGEDDRRIPITPMAPIARRRHRHRSVFSD